MLAGLPLRGRSFLEVGCGLGLPSLVLQQRGAQVTACDYHPLAQEFLDHNCELNGLLPIVFQLSDWSVHDPMLGRFDVLLASDTLYEQQHPTMLAAFFEQHAMPKCEIIVVDPGRGRVNLLTRLLEAQGYCTTNRRCSFGEEDSPPYRGQIVTYLRDTPLPSGPETTTST